MERKLFIYWNHHQSRRRYSGSYVASYTARKSYVPLISVVGKYFDFNTHVANDQAESYVENFNLAFGNVRWLSPLGYFDKQGNDVTRKVRVSSCPPNLAFLLIEACMYLGQLHSAFNATALFTHQYYLPQPQSYKTTGSSTPGRGVEKFHDSSATEVVEDIDEPGAGVFYFARTYGAETSDGGSRKK